ncbi:MAG: pilus assembly protein [Elusimicrobiota bacterium]
MVKLLRKAQVTVELLLVLPVFFLMLFTIMEFGLIAHKVIVVNHAAYEIARIGSLLAGPHGGQKNTASKIEYSKLEDVKCQIFGPTCGEVNLIATIDTTGYDPQVGPQHINEDIVVTLIYPVHLIFPGPNYFLADPPRNVHIKRIRVTVRMPIEKPLFQSTSF